MGLKLADIQKIEVAPAPTPTPLRGLALGADGMVPASVLPARVAGNIPAAGTMPTAGTGFTYTHAATGIYVFAFSPAFAAVPNIQCTLDVAPAVAGPRPLIGHSGVTVNGFTVTILDNLTGALVDEPFHFTAQATVS